MQKLKQLEKIARQLEPTRSMRSDIFRKANSYINHFIETLPDSLGYKNGECTNLHKLNIEEQGKPLDFLLDILKEEVDAVGINSASGAHLGYIPGGGIWSSAVADMLAATSNRYAGIAYSSPGAVAIENQMIRWLSSIMGYPETAHGNLSSGGSIASQIAIQTARDAHNIHSKNVSEAVIYVTGQTHHSIHKAFYTTGLHEATIRKIPVNNYYQMDTEALQSQMERDSASGLTPFLVIATAGTTNTGAIDPLDDIAHLCRKYGTWFHVDAAYGGFFLLVDELTAKFKGIEQSDSVVMDPHKTLFIPYGLGIVLVKNKSALLNSFSSKAAYMKEAYASEDISPADCGPELSKHFRGLRMWLPLHLHGLEPFRANLEEKILLCRFFHQEIGKTGLQIGPDPELSISLFRYSGDENNVLTQKLLETLHADGSFFFSSTTIDDKLWIRCAVVSFRTHIREIKLALEMLRKAMDSV